MKMQIGSQKHSLVPVWPRQQVEEATGRLAQQEHLTRLGFLLLVTATKQTDCLGVNPPQ